MVQYKTLQSSLIANLLDCGVSDAEFFTDFVNTVENTQFIINGEETFLLDIRQEGDFIDLVFKNAKEIVDTVTIDDLILHSFQLVIETLSAHYEFDLEDYVNTTVNSVASSIYLDDSFNDVDELATSQIAEIKEIFHQL